MKIKKYALSTVFSTMVPRGEKSPQGYPAKMLLLLFGDASGDGSARGNQVKFAAAH